MNVDTSSPITHVSLCAGYGGIDLGLKRAIPSLRTIAFSEIESFACANLVSKMEAGLLDPAPIWTDLKTFPWSEFHGRVDILSFGYPCQPFSAAGKRLGAEDPRHLWPFIAAGIAAMRPSVCFAENVEGHISLGLPDVLQDLAGLGYRTTWGVASASECGAPHQRKRVFILAYDQRQRVEELGWQIAGASQFDSAWNDGGNLAWPSRPGEQQFAWEPPRVVANGQRPERRSDNIGTSGQGHQEAGAAGTCGETGTLVDAKSQRAGQRSELRSEECGSRGALPWDVEQSDQTVGNAQRMRPQGRNDTGSLQAMGISRAELAGDGQWDVADTSLMHRQRRQPRLGRRIGSEVDAAGGHEAQQRQTQPSLGRDADGLTHRLDDAVLHVSTDNRTDELRLLGNGVVPATAERAFRVLVGELMEAAP